jgi:hypothetical protein
MPTLIRRYSADDGTLDFNDDQEVDEWGYRRGDNITNEILVVRWPRLRQRHCQVSESDPGTWDDRCGGHRSAVVQGPPLPG